MGEKMEIVTDFIFLGSKITPDGDCSHEIKRCLLLERKPEYEGPNCSPQRTSSVLGEICTQGERQGFHGARDLMVKRCHQWQGQQETQRRKVGKKRSHGTRSKSRKYLGRTSVDKQHFWGDGRWIRLYPCPQITRKIAFSWGMIEGLPAVFLSPSCSPGSYRTVF